METTKTTITAAVLLALSAQALAAPGEPVFTKTWTDCVTGDNRFFAPGGGASYWDVDAGCDSYQNDVYERPMSQSFEPVAGRFGAVEYFENLDITQARAGFDANYLYVELDLAGRNQITSGGSVIPLGMDARYGFRLSTDPDGRFGLLLVSDQPELKLFPATQWGTTGLFGYLDTNGDVGGAASSGPTGLTVTKTDNPEEESGLNGFDLALISDGSLNTGAPVLYARLSPTDNTRVQFALEYARVGFTAQELRTLGYFDFEAVKGGGGESTYLWNDKYENVEAGSPNPGPTGQTSEFGTNGLQSIYELDTLRGGPIANCPADRNGDGSVDFFDLSAFLGAFNAAQPDTDLNNDGVFNFFDVSIYLAQFNAGCP
jgi:hypothetical protein